MDLDGDDDPTQALDAFLLRARMRVGHTLNGKWHLDVLLGMGGMATVYAATHRNGSRAAVKILHPELSINSQLRSRFLREGYLANAVGHEGAVKVIDDDVADDGSLFLVTELLDGETLEERRRRFGGSLPEDEVLLVADQLLDVLVAAHSKGIVHRDLKPENIFLTRTGQLKVLDFGIARLRELSTISTATKMGVTLGTPAFMPPEQARGLWDEVEARTDLWACGATMFHLLSGRWVHEGRSDNETLLSAMTKAALPCSSVSPHTSLAVARVVDRALAFERDHRWLDAGSMQRAVRRAYGDRYGTAITTAPRLAVPDFVDRTLPSAQSGPGLDTDRPVESNRRDRTATRPPTMSVALAIGGAVALGAAAMGAVWALSSRHVLATATGAASAIATSAREVTMAFSAVESPSDSAGVAHAADTGVASATTAAPDAEGVRDSAPPGDALTKHPLSPRQFQLAPAVPPVPAAPLSSAPTGYKTDLPY